MLGFADDASVFRGPFRETYMRPLGREPTFDKFELRASNPSRAEAFDRAKGTTGSGEIDAHRSCRR